MTKRSHNPLSPPRPRLSNGRRLLDSHPSVYDTLPHRKRKPGSLTTNSVIRVTQHPLTNILYALEATCAYFLERGNYPFVIPAKAELSPSEDQTPERCQLAVGRSITTLACSLRTARTIAIKQLLAKATLYIRPHVVCCIVSILNVVLAIVQLVAADEAGSQDARRDV